MNDTNENLERGPLLPSSLSSSGNKLESNFDDILSRMRQACGVVGDKKLSEVLDITYSAITAARKRGTIPPAWYVTISEKYGVSMDWLLTGEGELLRGGAKFAKMRPGERCDESYSGSPDGPLWKAGLYQRRTEEPGPQAPIYNDAGQQSGIGDLVAKTIEVLQSNTVFETALKSNIEAFHRAIVLEKQIDQVEARIMVKIGSRLDALESSNQQLQSENKDLHHELEKARAASAIRDTD